MTASTDLFTGFRPLQQTPAERVAGRASRDALERGATREEADALFQRLVSGLPPEQARLYAPPSIDLTSVSPEAFMILLSAQVGREDQEVMAAQNEIQAAIAASNALSQRMQVLQTIHQRLSQDSDGKLHMGSATIVINDQVMTIGEAVTSFGLEQELNLTDAMNGDGWPHNTELSADSVQSAIDGLRQEQQKVTSSNELNMIRMQQAMQQRGQHIQLVSKVLAMLAETDRAIVGNMR